MGQRAAKIIGRASMAKDYRRLAIAVAIIAASAAFAGPAGAQLRDFLRLPWGGGPSYPSNSYDPFYPRPQVYEPTKPPPPRKVETPPTETIVVVGDQLADWLAYGLEETFSDTPGVGIVRKIKPYAGLVRYEARFDAPDWSQAIKDVLATEKPSAIVVMLGVNDRLPLRERTPEKDKKGAAPSPQGQAATPPAQPPSESAQPDPDQPTIAAPETARRSPNGYNEFHTDRWAELYAKRIDDMIAALKSKGVPVLWVGLPAVRGTKSTSDMSYLDELYRSRAEKAGIVYVDTWDGFVDEKGLFAVQGPDFEGQIRRLRTSDGVNFTKAGAEKLARYVEHDLRRVLTNHFIPVALPGPEEQSPAKGNTRPAIGPIVPLNAVGGAEGGDLLGATSRPAQREADPVATRVLSHGDAIVAPPGRADDFSWPRADANANSVPDLTPVPVAPSPTSSAPAAKGAAGKNDANKADPKKDAKKPGDAKNDGKIQPVPNAVPGKPRQTLDGAPPNVAPPRPPLPVGPAATNIRGGY
jgi:hypothetical protein